MSIIQSFQYEITWVFIPTCIRDIEAEWEDFWGVCFLKLCKQGEVGIGVDKVVSAVSSQFRKALPNTPAPNCSIDRLCIPTRDLFQWCQGWRVNFMVRTSSADYGAARSAVLRILSGLCDTSWRDQLVMFAAVKGWESLVVHSRHLSALV